MATVPRIAAVSYLDTIPFLYGVRHAAERHAEVLLSDFPQAIDRLRRSEADAALVPVHAVPTLPGARIITGYCIAAPSPLLIEALGACDPHADILRYFTSEEAPLAALMAAGDPFAYAVWVAREDADPAVEELLEHALTYGLEHSYEAVVEAGYADKPYDAYGYLTQVDFLFDLEKRRALEKFWAAGLKTAPHANPG